MSFKKSLRLKYLSVLLPLLAMTLTPSAYADVTTSSANWPLIMNNALAAGFALIALIGLLMGGNLAKKIYYREEVEEIGKKFGIAFLCLAIGGGSALATFETEAGFTSGNGTYKPMSIEK